MIDWGLSAIIIAVITFVSSMITDTKLKRLTNKCALLEKQVNDLAEDSTNDNGSADTNV